MARGLHELPVVTRCLVIGMLVGGVPGCITGLIRGLQVHPPTAWAATFEIGIPAALAGMILGTVLGLLAIMHRRVHQVLEHRQS